MKKTLLFILSSAILVGAGAQNLSSKKGENYLPENGDWAISVNPESILTWLGNIANGNENNAAPNVSSVIDAAVVGKKFTSDNTAKRYTVGFEISSGNNSTASGGNTNEVKENNFGVVYGLGREYRRGKTRLQGYYGADALFTVGSSSRTETNSLNGVGNKEVETSSGLGFGIGVNGFIGAEYFVLPKMSVGAQYEAGVSLYSSGEGEQKTTNWTGSTITNNIPKSSGFGIGPVGTASLRLNLYF